MRLKKKYFPESILTPTFCNKKTGSKLVKFGLCGPIYVLQPPIGGSHPVPCLGTQIPERDMVQQCTTPPSGILYWFYRQIWKFTPNVPFFWRASLIDCCPIHFQKIIKAWICLQEIDGQTFWWLFKNWPPAPHQGHPSQTKIHLQSSKMRHLKTTTTDWPISVATGWRLAKHWGDIMLRSVRRHIVFKTAEGSDYFHLWSCNYGSLASRRYNLIYKDAQPGDWQLQRKKRSRDLH